MPTQALDEARTDRHLSLRAVAPGLILILVVDVFAVAGIWPQTGWVNDCLTLMLASLPWATVVVLGKSTRILGYVRKEFLRVFGWGVVAGGFWRLLSMLFNLGWLNLGSAGGWLFPLVGALIWVPLIEETFFRGYLGRALSHALGVWPGILLQAILFTFQPVHWSQAGIGILSVLGFGILAGWLQQRWDSIWPAWGAHAFANLLPLLLSFA
ncbi:MAG: CPBP family intramembrane metalloprotease [Anaerolineales bacterium]|nr:MAG: CPBP family intramembrane metalloprotease [Anaerolineales bacterium]